MNLTNVDTLEGWKEQKNDVGWKLRVKNSMERVDMGWNLNYGEFGLVMSSVSCFCSQKNPS